MLQSLLKRKLAAGNGDGDVAEVGGAGEGLRGTPAVAKAGTMPRPRRAIHPLRGWWKRSRAYCSGPLRDPGCVPWPSPVPALVPLPLP
jgi:hypothetical protein